MWEKLSPESRFGPSGLRYGRFLVATYLTYADLPAIGPLMDHSEGWSGQELQKIGAQ